MMMDQRAKYTPRGMQAEFLGEAQTDPAIKDKVLRVVQLVFITLESIISSSAYRKMLLSAVYIEKLIAVVVDEVHCVKTWGDQFRTTLAQIGDLQSLIPSTINILALTAMATSETLCVVRCRLSMDKPTLIALTPCRDNIKSSSF